MLTPASSHLASKMSVERELVAYKEKRDRLYHGWQTIEREMQQRVVFHNSCVNREIKSDRMTEREVREMFIVVFSG